MKRLLFLSVLACGAVALAQAPGGLCCGGASSGATTTADVRTVCVNSNIAAASTSATMGDLASCTIPGGTLAVGDTVRITARYAHTGTTINPRFEIMFNSTANTSEQQASAVTIVGFNLASDLFILGSSSQYASAIIRQDGSGTLLNLSAGLSALTMPIASNIVVHIRARMTTGGSESIAVVGYAVEILKNK